ncbi:MAG TPA: acyltransferase [Lamprocystis sp. (in: g-proteobacteria)]|nr:acyltransferase [Lamprocystis sp. (in: g-proteobacteria)]
MAVGSLRHWVKRRDHSVSRVIYVIAKGTRAIEVPVIPGLHFALYQLHRAIVGAFATVLRVCYYTPLFKSRLEAPAPRLYLYSGLPLLSGALRIRLGSDCRVSGITTLSGRTSGRVTPSLEVGSNVDIGWQNTIAVGTRVVLGDNVRLAGRCLLVGYPGHPLDPAARARGEAETEDQVGDIILEDDVWLATGVTVTAGVRIGRGTVVAAGSVVTKDLPPMVLAGGVPARVIRSIRPDDRSRNDGQITI